MAKYRRISPVQAWRSSISCDLTISERFGEYYTLTSPFTNTIGCYPIVPRIAAAEMGLSVDEFTNVLSRLGDRRIVVFQDGWLLVRTWFLHNQWEATFVGNVAKAVRREAASLPSALHDEWLIACRDAGVPEDTLRPFARVSNAARASGGREADRFEDVSECPARDLGGTSKGLPRGSEAFGKGVEHNNNNDNKPNLNITTTTTASWLASLISPHEVMLDQLFKDVDAITKSKVVQELAGALDAARRGKRPPIDSVRAWVADLIKKEKQGLFFPEYASLNADIGSESVQQRDDGARVTVVGSSALKEALRGLRREEQ
ncbi:hypothetical protein [Paraburkholderia tropica]|uniref:hypothetical protein n=1 Tax=Paraburkholderia tropica TaxID=92647 RepID=UPI002AB2E567|nr:hypothetical protein [Paraburkholderia tropica]